ncbi:helicase HerA domain-containing protein [Psychromonas sp. KJ10-2]|uniref:helicase HerA domain-containing protein n=1 Tax=Psychromonas sp. KJ10-2 TaxID=3391822 RepID=UPI0039B46B71
MNKRNRSYQIRDIVKNEHSSDLIESTPESLMPLDYLDSSVLPSGAEPALMEQTGDVDLNSIAIEIGVCKETGEKQYWTPTDTNRYLNPNFAVLGTMGTGKTQSVKSLLAQLTSQKRKNTNGLPFGILVFDYKSDYIGDDFVKETGATVLDANAIPINPLTLYFKT